MNKEQFLKELKKNLKYLNNKNLKEALSKYDNLDNYSLDPLKEANKIYQEYNINIVIYPKISLFDAISIIIKNIQEKQNIKNIILFFLYLFFLLIIIKIPFIYVRDIIVNIFGLSFTEQAYTIWNLSFEILYAIATILILIHLIKKKANTLKK